MHTVTTHLAVTTAAVLLAFTLGCNTTGSKSDTADTAAATTGGPTGGGTGGTTTGVGTGTPGHSTPSVISTLPLAGADGTPVNLAASAVFSEEMDADTLSATTFSLSMGDPAVRVDGTVIYADSTATFWPADHLVVNTEYTATISTDASSAAGIPLTADHSWSFTTGVDVAPGLPVDLGTAAGFVVLAKSGISSVPASIITGDIGVSPAAATYITGFSLTADASNTFATSPQVIGKVYASDYAPPTPTNLTVAIGDMERALTDAASRAPDVTELGAGNVGGMTLAPGVYKWGTGLLIPTDLTLEGTATDVWIFQIAQDLTVASAASVMLSGGANAENIFWQVTGMVDIGTTAHVEGTVLTATSLNMRTGASLNGRLLAQTAVDLDGGTVTAP